MNAGTKFGIGAVLIVGSVGYLMASGVKQTGQYFLTPTELTQKIAVDPSFYDVGMKVGARVVPGTVSKDVATQTLRFQVTDGSARYPVVFHGLPPDTFNDSVEVVRSEEHTSELQSRRDLVCRLLLEKKKKNIYTKQASIKTERC